jgi:hypothetical protein
MQANKGGTSSQETHAAGHHRHFFAPRDRCLVPYAAKLGYTEDDLMDIDLNERLLEEYVRSYGHEPADNWILIVRPDESSEIHHFDDPADMWCCQRRPAIRESIEAGVALGGPERETSE